MKKRKLSTKVILAVVFFALLIIVATCLSVVLRYRKDIMERYSSQGFAYARTAAAYIDGDTIRSIWRPDRRMLIMMRLKAF